MRGWGASAALVEGDQMAKLNSGDIPIGDVQGGSHSAGRCGISKKAGTQQGRKLVVSTLDGSIWSKRSIALTCPARSHFQRTQSRERWGRGWDERYHSSTEGGE